MEIVNYNPNSFRSIGLYASKIDRNSPSVNFTKSIVKIIYTVVSCIIGIIAGFYVAIGFFLLMNIRVFLSGWCKIERYIKGKAKEINLNQEIYKQDIALAAKPAIPAPHKECAIRMVRIAAYDVNNPIGGMTIVSGILLDEACETQNDQLMLELIKTSGQNSLELVDALLQGHTKDAIKESIDLYQILHCCVGFLNYKAKIKGQHINLHGAPITVYINLEQIWRVVCNLIDNAIKFSHRGGIIDVTLQEKQNRVCITVEDHGIGIPKELQSKLFDLFTEAKRTGTNGEQPFGLGLAISKEIIEAHEGTISFESEKNIGTTFFVELPISQA